MATAVNQPHPLVRDGQSQIERLDLHKLAPDSVRLDDRSEHQLLVYLNEFAKSVVFYKTDDSPEKTIRQTNWQPFFKASAPVQLSLIETFDLVDYSHQYDATRQGFAEGLNQANYTPWLDFLFDSALTVNGWFVALSSDVVLLDNQAILNETPLRRTIQDLIQSNLQPALGQLFGVANLLLQPTKNKRGYQFPDLSELEKESIWNLESIRYGRDTTLTSLNHRPVEQTRRIQERLNDIFQTFAKTNRQIIEAAAAEDILQTTRSTHEPHLTLLYTFVRLLRPVIDDFNGLTQKHLDFYYRDVLKLSPKPLVPDSAHVLFELPKPISQYRLPKDTLLKDGKDGHKVDVRFALNDELVVNQTQVAELRTLLRDETTLWAKPKANTLDGLGKAFPDPLDTKWAILGDAGTGSKPEAAKATIGLAIASKTLLLSSGIRTVTLTLTGGDIPKSMPSPFPDDAFSVKLSGAKKWVVPKNGVVTVLNLATNELTVTFELGIKEEAIVAADPAVLGVDYKLTDGQAVAQLVLKNGQGLYDAMRQFTVTGVRVGADVSQVQDVLVRTDIGDQDPTKPFMPFGAVPAVDSAFSIGSPEIFSKDLKSLTIDFDWDKKPDKFGDYYAGYKLAISNVPTSDNSFTRRVFYYTNGKPVNELVPSGNVFQPLTFSAGPLVNDFQAQPITPPVPLPPPVTKEADWQDGFVLIQLKQDFLHQYFAEALTRKSLLLANQATQIQVVSKAQVDDVEKKIDNLPFAALSHDATAAEQESLINDIKARANLEVDTLKTIPPDELTINPPYTPVIKNLTVSYSAEATEANLFQLLPFDDGVNYRPIQLNDALLYNFKEKKEAVTDPEPATDRGTLLIGLSNAVEGSLVPILFQLLESSAKTNVNAAKINWSYLDGNDWRELILGKNLVNDATKGFIQSGIVQVILPNRESTETSTLLPAQFYWLKAATTDTTDAVCKAIGVHAQAALSTFEPILADNPAKGSDPTRLAVPLPAGSITKLDTADSNIKTVSQPYPSFGGRPAETDRHYYRRVSEQLRHKGRAITLFDYEQIILEAFPEVFKVKCIPHTFANRSIGDNRSIIDDVHVAPGHVSVVVVPDATLTQLDDPEQPMASRGLLKRVEERLRTCISPFVKLQVLNPVYEKVDTEFKVKFYPGKSPEFYAEQLKKEIGRFLAPWAFDPLAQVTFGGVIYRSSILGFIENRDYVDFVTDFVMKTKGVAKEEILASAARVVFTNGMHTITPFAPVSVPQAAAAHQGIGYTSWKIRPKPTSDQ